MEEDLNRFIEYDELTEEQKRMKEAGDEAYEELVEYNRLTTGKA